MRAVTYEPDEHDELVGEALAVGGPVFVEALHWAATEAAEQSCPWDGYGDEPLEYRSAWLTAARRIVADRRTAHMLRQLLSSTDGVREHHELPGAATPSGRPTFRQRSLSRTASEGRIPTRRCRA